ncbi:relaxase MobL [Acetatifactor muris]|uniref:Beta-lactamase HcpC n=1 Tax=Acetatifactor muris TaxID=879566 RepID=A0A2K4ZN48_9FIRM|nr:MobP3 family relaxase [Acetatifactor muris]MCR2050184.1 relaxase MobL [Acetatifactor muris]SOY31846.1 Putative beta-lactamase HcpC precursor [Acetatifactor muris]
MPKIIFTSRYLRDAPPAQLENYVRYVSTREGVEKVEGSRQNLPSTAQQKDLIRQIVRDFPSAKGMLEYADFLLHPTMGNASEFISCAMEQNLDLIGKRENYVDYIANRPRVERLGDHGLFTDAGKAVVLKQVQEEVTGHKGPVWTHVISLRREDAARLGYDSAAQWMALLRSKRAMLCRYMKIDSASLRWYAAFHNEGHHPHVHLMVYSAKDNDGYLTEKSIETMRSELAHDIFRQDFAHIYEKQNQARADLKKGAADVVQGMMDALRQSTVASAEIEKMMVQLAGRLRNTGGKKVYGYLKRDVKNLVDRIVDELAKDERIDALYRAWGKWQDEILSTYQNNLPPLPPLSGQPQFKSLKNMVIAEALKLGSGNFIFEDEAAPDQEEPEDGERLFLDGAELPDGEGVTDQFPEDAPDWFPGNVPDWLMEDVDGARTPEDGAAERGSPKGDRGIPAFYAEWNKDYKLARRYLYGEKDTGQDFTKALSLFRQEAENGNALAMHDLGRMCADGLGQDADQDAAQEWYAKALEAFHGAEKKAKERKRPYLQYRIGKMYAAGLGTGQDYGAAARWLAQAAGAGYKYAQYSLAGLYRRGQGVAQDNVQAFLLYGRSAGKGNPYADYELAKMYRDGIGTQKDGTQAGAHFQNAFGGFLKLEAKGGDDKLQYRLGQMLHTGTGTERDDGAAAAYWERAAKLGNVHAQYALGKLWLETGGGNPAQAVRWITKAAEAGNAAAQYTLGKLFLSGEIVEKDAARAVELFTLSAGQGNDHAAYCLGRLYLSGEEIPGDTAEAVCWLTLSAEKGNQYAQYALGKLYLSGEDIPRDVEKGIYWLERSANQGNQYAQYALGKLYLSGEDISRDVEKAIYWLEQSAGQGNQYAQYALGKLYLCGKDVPCDRDKATAYLQAAAEQGNIYAAFLLEHMDSFRDPDLFLATTRLMHRLEKLFREDVHRAAGGSPFHIDRKRRRRLSEKKQAQGHKRDDREPVQQQI